MIKSMTGYGSASGSCDKLAITVELRSVNNRFLDCSVRIPRGYIAAEEPIKSMVQSRISRGKVDVYVTIDASAADDVVISVNEPLAAAYHQAFARLSEEYHVPNDLTAGTLARFPDVLLVEKKEADTDAVTKAICEVLSEALDSFDAMRQTEGDKLRTDILTRANEIERLTELAAVRSPVTVEEYRKKLEQRMQEVLSATTIDEARILTEAAIFADRVAVNEELVRLRSHLSQLRDFMDSPVPIGRKIDFLVQEFNREANTLGSKGNDLEMARIVVDLKAEIEKVREQIQNIE